MSWSRALWYGLAFGTVLGVFGLASTGAGHGTYLPSYIFGAPLSLVPFLGLFAAPVVWGVFGWLLRSEQPWRAVAALSIHTAVVALIVMAESASAYRLNALFVRTGLAMYTVGLIAAWLLAIARTRR